MRHEVAFSLDTDLSVLVAARIEARVKTEKREMHRGKSIRERAESASSNPRLRTRSRGPNRR